MSESFKMKFEGKNAEGELEIVGGHDGADIKVNGQEVAWVDLFPPTEGNPPQILIWSPGWDTPLCKVILDKDRPKLVVNRHARYTTTPHTIHHEADQVFMLYGEEP